MCLVYVCAYTPRSGFNIVYSCVHTLSHDYTTALTIYGYSLLYTYTLCTVNQYSAGRSDFNIVYSCVHTLSHDYTTALTIYG